MNLLESLEEAKSFEYMNYDEAIVLADTIYMQRYASRPSLGTNGTNNTGYQAENVALPGDPASVDSACYCAPGRNCDPNCCP